MEVVILTDVFEHGWIRSAGAYRLATELRENNISTQVIDFAARLTYDEAVKVFDKFLTKETKVVGISNTFLHKDFKKLFDQDWMLSLLKEYKNKFNFKVVLGGNRFGLAHYDIVVDDPIDLVVLGFADKALVDIVNAIRCDKFNSLYTTEYKNIRLLDCKHPDYAYNDFQKSKIIWTEQDCILPGEALPIETARGCIFRCSYCFFPGNGKRSSNDHIKQKRILTEELIKNYEDFGTTVYDIMDDLLNDSPEKCQFIYDVFSNLPFNVQYASYARADLLISHPHTLDLLKESGCMSMQFGIETLNKDAGKTIGKSMNREKMTNGLRQIKDNAPEISLGSGFIVGLPNETIESLEETVNWLDSKDCPLSNSEIYTLSLPKLRGRFDQSKMMINPEVYGYKDLDPSHKDRIIWDNGIMNFYEAEKLAEKYKKQLGSHNIVNSHQLIRFMNIGVSAKTAISTPRYELAERIGSGPKGIPELKKKEEYLEKLLRL
jgi:hypothetical protein